MKHLGDYFDSGRMFTFLRGYAMAKGWNETLQAMNFARSKHGDQFRNSGEPYIIHPLTMANQAIAMGIDSDEMIAVILYHDVVEDCDVNLRDLPTKNREIISAVAALTFVKPGYYAEKDGPTYPSLATIKKLYYDGIADNKLASFVKIFDRCNNISTMSGIFSRERLLDYIEETHTYVMPLLRSTKEKYPEYQSMLFLLKYHITSVLSSIEGAMEMYTGTNK